jgi:hypothetical protein
LALVSDPGEPHVLEPVLAAEAVVGCLRDLLLLSRLLGLWHSSWSAMETLRTSWTSETRTLANVAGLLMRLLLLALLGSNW